VTELRIVTTQAVIDPAICTGCKTCEKVCPTESVRVGENKKAVVNLETCTGCGNCESRCPVFAIKLVALKEKKVIELDWTRAPKDKVIALCKKARFHPEAVLCYCTGTRAREVAASILLGAKTPEEISRVTGIRTGCSVECIQPNLRLLTAAGVPLGKAPGWQWYGLTSTNWDLPDSVVKNPAHKKFYFEADRKLMERVVEAKGGAK
jgi:NAD-dependent dihydropyrimidine dehydrogenase PreA subunit